eukprot:TRINITY_DN6232_c0_g1_i1.p1 TRINITY_DN6232_c0_g1~~TRINITY_DN6232_c0_g1_i1.p1  ORF type:complete len:139 (+),score=3.10 TRINITY_DN6232_c0_g1_i1:182-598(+)
MTRFREYARKGTHIPGRRPVLDKKNIPRLKVWDLERDDVMQRLPSVPLPPAYTSPLDRRGPSRKQRAKAESTPLPGDPLKITAIFTDTELASLFGDDLVAELVRPEPVTEPTRKQPARQTKCTEFHSFSTQTHVCSYV